ncbi:protein of unknown function [Rhodovastum atsumiense]|uniref:hypothetical protein n=1 Tax=Rhodovastum atsumiense TaxID=504468 RepID=UPI00139F29F6|nr:hypothetical protein [Rhodovastum atsumiense]CAH2599421.1 protein of unknown function [Rhodovastum atsumiense]
MLMDQISAQWLLLAATVAFLLGCALIALRPDRWLLAIVPLVGGMALGGALFAGLRF